ncbi:hypothetical protein [Leisingera thetidis]|uniref:hypothetical protein n=1 Tax=Leisingera thetidis TaxID=2930199 RepID=UPI0021F6B883|nr:hypothetical protein [Leisingera thetidis]
MTLHIRLQSQPWHLFSRNIVRAFLTASTGLDGKMAARRVMQAVFGNRTEFDFTNHCAGPNRQATPDGVLSRIEALSGVVVADAFNLPDLDQELEWHCKYARQNGIHVSPTFMADGLVRSVLGSREPVEQWEAALQ